MGEGLSGMQPGRQVGRRLRRVRGRPRADCSQPNLADALASLLESMGGTRERAGLQHLWDNWQAALGDELAAMARPLGHKAPRKTDPGSAPAGATLLLSAGDAMLLQELSLRSLEILERVNGFLGRPYFAEVRVSLALGRSAPERSRAREEAREQEGYGAAPLAQGLYLEGMDLDSPVARCYACFARRKKLLEKELGMPPENTDEK